MHSEIFIIGAGRLGTTLAYAIQSVQFRIRHFYNYSDRNIDNLRNHFPGVSIWNELDIKALNECDTFFLTVRDDLLPALISTLKNLDISWENKIFIHTSGLLTSSILLPLAKKGSDVASMHPMQTFSSKFIPSNIFHGVYLVCEGTPPAMIYCKNIARKLKANFLSIKSTSKVPYHLAGTVAANLFFALIDISDKLFNECGITKNIRKNIIESLTRQVIENYKHAGAKSSLTGPLVRGDIITIQQHLNHISENHPEIRAIYQNLSNYILNEILNSDSKRKNNLKSLFE